MVLYGGRVEVTMRHVAERAGVSIITVSRVINRKGYIRESTRSKVEAAIRDLQYVPNGLAGSLRSGQTSTLALLLTDITNSFWTTLARGVEDEAGADGYGVFLCNTDEDPAKEALYLDRLLRYRVDGLLIGPTPDSAPLLRRLQREQIKFVLLDRTVEGIEADVIRGDSRAGAMSLTKHLLMTGFRRIAYIGGPLSTSTGYDRLAGYKDGLDAAEVAVDADLIKTGSYGQEGGYRMSIELLTANNRPEAMITGNNQIALGVLRALSEASLCVPEDIALVSFDDIHGVSSYWPFLTCAAQPAYTIGQLGVRRLLEQIHGERTQVQETILPTELLIRTSCGCNA